MLKITSMIAVEKANNVIAKYWDGVLPVNTASIAAKMGIIASHNDEIETTPGEMEMAGWCENRGGKKLIYINKKSELARQRFFVAHAIGHFLLDHLGTGDCSMPKEYATTLSMSAENGWREKQANEFALAILMPAQAVEHVLQSGQASNLADMAKVFGTSQAAVKWRVDSLRIFENL